MEVESEFCVGAEYFLQVTQFVEQKLLFLLMNTFSLKQIMCFTLYPLHVPVHESFDLTSVTFIASLYICLGNKSRLYLLSVFCQVGLASLLSAPDSGYGMVAPEGLIRLTKITYTKKTISLENFLAKYSTTHCSHQSRTAWDTKYMYCISKIMVLIK